MNGTYCCTEHQLTADSNRTVTCTSSLRYHSRATNRRDVQYVELVVVHQAVKEPIAEPLHQAVVDIAEPAVRPPVTAATMCCSRIGFYTSKYSTTTSNNTTLRANGTFPQQDTSALSPGAAVGLLKTITKDNYFDVLVSLGVECVEDIRAEKARLQEEAIGTYALRAALESARPQVRTTAGLRTYQTLLTAAAHAHVSLGESAPKVLEQRCAELFGVPKIVWRDARRRYKSLVATLHPDKALEQGAYWYEGRERRSGATPQALLELMRQYWHNPDVSRVTGNASDKDMYRVSKARGAAFYPWQQFVIMGGGEAVYPQFLESSVWFNYKKIDPACKEPGRTLFLSTRCKCLTLPKKEQCACVIHTQQVHYLTALKEIMKTLHIGSSCNCRWCADGGKQWTAAFEHLGTFSEALCCAKVDWRAGDLDGAEFWGRKAKCVSGECGECRFGKQGGIPLCSVLNAATDTVKWTHYEDVTTAGGKNCAQQQVEKTSTFQEIWKEFKAHSTKYLVHHSTAKWQRDCHKLCLDMFKDGDLVIESDFIEKHPLEGKVVTTCQQTPTATMMVAIVHHSPNVHEGGGRMHVTETWIFVSED